MAGTLTYEQLGQKVKAKYPEYKDIADGELGQKIAAKYPEYQSQLIQKPQPSMMQKVANFIAPAMTKYSKLATSAIANNSRKGQQAVESQGGEVDSVNRLYQAAERETDPTKKAAYQKLADQAQAALQSNLSGRQSQILDNSGLTKEQSQQSKWEMGARAGAGAALETGSFLTPQAKAFRGATGAQRIGNAALTGATAGTLSGGSRATQSDSVGEAVTETGAGLVTGATTGAVLQGGGELLDLLKNSPKLRKFAEDWAKSSYANTLKTSSAEGSAINSFYRKAGKVTDDAGKVRSQGRLGTAERAMKDNLPKSLDGATKELNKLQDGFNDSISEAVKKSPKANADYTNEVVKTIDDTLAGIQEYNRPGLREGYKEAVKYLKDARKTYGKKTDLLGVNSLRLEVDEITKMNAVSKTDVEQKAYKALRTKLSEIVKRDAEGTVPLFNKYFMLKGLSDVMMKEPKMGLTELVGSSPVAIGFAMSNPNNLFQTILGGTAMAGIVKGIRSPALKRFSAQGAYNFAKSAPSMAGQKASTIPYGPAATAMDRLINRN